MSQVEEFKTGLMQLKPSDDEFPVQVDELLESIPKELHESLIPSIFQFFEAHPIEECGMPGGLVHLVEDYYPNYKQILIRSMQKAPNFSSILMVNRILNSELSEDERNQYTALLIELSNNSGADEALRINAKDFIKFQSEKSS